MIILFIFIAYFGILFFCVYKLFGRTRHLLSLLYEAGKAVSYHEFRFQMQEARYEQVWSALGYYPDNTCGRRSPCLYNPKTWHTISCTPHALIWTMLNMSRCAW